MDPGNRFAIYKGIKSICWTPETYTMLCVNYNSIKLGGKMDPTSCLVPFHGEQCLWCVNSTYSSPL